jgi:AraC-like DNA-binding protein
MAPSASDFVSVRFSTDDLPDRDRHAFVREVLGRQILGAEITALTDGPVCSHFALTALPGLFFTSGENSGFRLERTRRDLADGKDDLFLSIQTAGVTIASQLGRERTFCPGEVTLLSGAETGFAAFPSASRLVSIALSRAALAPLVPGLDDALMRPLPSGSEALRLLASYLHELENGYALAVPELRRVVVGHVYDLAALVIGPGRDAAEAASARGLRAARVREILAVIRAGFPDPAFSLHRVARKVSLSPRYVQDLLHETGASFTELVLRLRLEKAQTMLADPRNDRMKIIEVAYACGFNEVSYFNRSFRRQFGASPTALRANGSA